jgi:3-deoxy-D-manno-octulosonate 8-phosphate phosphatase KdsC-like HAD superfamily phosphatase
MALEGMYVDPASGRLKNGKLLVLQQMGEMADGKLHFVAGQDAHIFNIEDGDKFFTAIFAVDPFKD